MLLPALIKPRKPKSKVSLSYICKCASIQRNHRAYNGEHIRRLDPVCCEQRLEPRSSPMCKLGDRLPTRLQASWCCSAPGGKQRASAWHLRRSSWPMQAIYHIDCQCQRETLESAAIYLVEQDLGVLRCALRTLLLWAQSTQQSLNVATSSTQSTLPP